jgi:hypothetical protein
VTPAFVAPMECTPADALPDDLLPATRFTDRQIRRGLPAPGRFGLKDCRHLARFARA